MNAWGKTLDADKSSGIRFLGDANGELTKALDTEFESAAFLGNNRCKRFAIKTNDGKITDVQIESDSTGVTGQLKLAPTSETRIMLISVQFPVPARSSDEQFYEKCMAKLEQRRQSALS